MHENEDDPRSVEEHNKGLKEEMKKSKPRDNLLLPLMKKIFSSRRIYIQSEASTVAETLEQYPAMVRPAIVSVLLVLGIMQWDWEQNWWGSSVLLLVCIDCIPEVKTPCPGKVHLNPPCSVMTLLHKLHA